VVQTARTRAQTGQRCFAETAFCIEGRIREFWEQNGGLPVFGYPITPQRAEVIEGETRQAQWFQRNRLELHPENARPYDVLLGRVGVDVLEQQGRDWRNFPTSQPQPGCRFFPETGHNVCGDILLAWRASGLELDGVPGISQEESLALFGLPISEARPERLSDGETYTVQWFERARFEMHQEDTASDVVLLGLLGTEMREAEPVAAAPTPTAETVFVPTPTRAAPTPQAATPTPTPAVGDPRRIAFVSDRDGNNDIFVMNADGSQAVNLTSNPADDNQPAWSPGGTQIAFVSNRTGNNDIFVMNADGSALFNLTRSSAQDSHPVWSPDGSSIAFASERRGKTDIYTINTFGSGLTNLTNASGTNEAPAWSPDGTRMAFASDRDNGDWEIYVMDSDGSNQTNISRSDEDDRDPHWAPDSWRLAFVSNRESGWDLFVMSGNGSEQTDLTNSIDDEGAPAWSPDGRDIAFHSLVFAAGETPNYDIYAINMENGQQRNISQHPANDTQPAWSPVLP
jgi:Tol biopolymer transport system component